MDTISKITRFALPVLLWFSACSPARTQMLDLFKTGDRVCFVGNSITHEGNFTNYITLYYATRYPDRKVNFYNAGVAGDAADDILARMDADILSNHPTVTVLMVGMNDVRRELYDLKNAGDTAIDHQKQLALKNYQVKTIKIADRFQQAGIRQVFELPTIYDETSRFAKITAKGINAALGQCAVFLRATAPKYDAGIVDYYSLLNRVNHDGQLKDAAFTIIGDDRVHPQQPGNLIMAYQFIKSMGIDGVVSRTVIDIKKSTPELLDNCSVKIIDSKSNALHFESTEKALPFPVEAAALPALNYVNFTQALNQEVLQVKNLEAGNYRLLIDQTDAGTFSATALSSGVNLAMNNATPQYKQALSVQNYCNQYHDVQLSLRGIAFVEYTKLNQLHLKDFKANEAYLAAHPESNEYLAAKDKQYLTFKPQQQQLTKQLDTIRDLIYKANQPKKHVFELVKVD